MVNFVLGNSGEVYAVLFKTGLRKNGKLRLYFHDHFVSVSVMYSEAYAYLVAV